MALIMGLDTGGTFTDASLVDTGAARVISTAKSLTTRHDLSVGVGDAMRQILLDAGQAQTPLSSSDIALVSLSTTLATNAVVEHVGSSACLILIGFDDEFLSRAGLKEALGHDPVITVSGGHKPDGRPQAQLDEAGLRAAVEELKDRASAFAVASHFATRNPEHEKQVKQIIHSITDRPVTCSHELSSSLGGPRRALTALLNARLIALIDRLIAATTDMMTELGLDCPLMVVKGDGSLLSAELARSRPVETILSGPAASLAGAAFLAGEPDGLVADIGGTTTDIALLKGGMPLLSHDGAHIGGWQTMVEAAQIRTSGLGGDSEVRPTHRGRQHGVRLGPRRAIPLSLLARQHPEIKPMLEAHLAQAIALPSDGRFIVPVMPDGVPDWLSRSEQKLAEQAITAPLTAVADIATTQVALGALDRLIARGLLLLSAFTPTDAAHILGLFSDFDTDAAILGGRLMARQKTGLGSELGATAEDVARMSLDGLTHQSCIALMDAACAEDGMGEQVISASEVLRERLRSDASPHKAVSIAASLRLPLIALGASSATHYPAIARRLGTELVNPEHAEVAGAVGAAAGSVRQRVLILVTQPSDGLFRIHHPDGPQDCSTQDEALSIAASAAEQAAQRRAELAGARSVSLSSSSEVEEIDLGNGKTLFLEARILAEAVGLPA